MLTLLLELVPELGASSRIPNTVPLGREAFRPNQ